jgi:hypothetical protein
VSFDYLLFLIVHLHLMARLGGHQGIHTHMFETYWTMTPKLTNYSTLNIEHNWEDLCIQSRNTCTSGNHTRTCPYFVYVKKGGFVNIF